MDTCQIKFKTHTDTQKEDKYLKQRGKTQAITLCTQRRREIWNRHTNMHEFPFQQLHHGIGCVTSLDQSDWLTVAAGPDVCYLSLMLFWMNIALDKTSPCAAHLKNTPLLFVHLFTPSVVYRLLQVALMMPSFCFHSCFISFFTLSHTFFYTKFWILLFPPGFFFHLCAQLQPFVMFFFLTQTMYLDIFSDVRSLTLRIAVQLAWSIWAILKYLSNSWTY